MQQYGPMYERISIHALCEEGDATPPAPARSRRDFYPRPLRGGRPSSFLSMSTSSAFLSTPSARRATARTWPRSPPPRISIHALCEEGDLRGRHRHGEQYRISIHALCEEGDSCKGYSRRSWCYFYPRPLRGGRPIPFVAASTSVNFYPRPLRGGRR